MKNIIQTSMTLEQQRKQRLTLGDPEVWNLNMFYLAV